MLVSVTGGLTAFEHLGKTHAVYFAIGCEWHFLQAVDLVWQHVAWQLCFKCFDKVALCDVTYIVKHYLALFLGVDTA